MLCGNKIDLRQSCIDEGKTVITQENGEKLAKVRNHFVHVLNIHIILSTPIFDSLTFVMRLRRSA